jgi:hypothetical protein
MKQRHLRTLRYNQYKYATAHVNDFTHKLEHMLTESGFKFAIAELESEALENIVGLSPNMRKAMHCRVAAFSACAPRRGVLPVLLFSTT